MTAATTTIAATTATITSRDADRYLAPGAVTRRVFNPLMRGLVRLGLDVRGARELQVAGRVSGRIQRVPVNPLEVDGVTYLVAPRGETEWVRNLRAADGRGALRHGRRVETIRAVEVVDADKPAILRPYVETWKAEVGQFFDGVGPDAADADFSRIAPGYPVFRIVDRS